MRKIFMLIAVAALLVAMTSCQTGAKAATAAKALTISKSWTFADTAKWPASLADGTVYDGITAIGPGIMTGKLNTPRTGMVNGESMTFTNRLQLPKTGSAAAGALKVPVAGPCTIIVAGLSSGSSATRDIVISNGKKDLFTKTLNLVSSPEPDVVTYNVTAADLVDGNVYLFTNDPGGAITIMYIGIGK